MNSSLILATIGMAAALDVHHDHSYAQVATQAAQAPKGTLAYCSEQFLDIQECLATFGPARTPAIPEFADWADQVTFGQAYCWLKYSEAYGWTSVESWGNDPTLADHHAFLMPNTREYEHFYNDPDCNQQFRMGRGREQPDAVTFGYVPAHDHNRLIMNNQVQVTPWISHDEMVLQFFGITDQCVEIMPDAVGAKKGLVDGQFRIEYQVAGATVTITGEDFGIMGDIAAADTPTALDNPLSTPVAVVGTVPVSGLFEAEVCVCRTPHYLAICTASMMNMACDTGCTANCEYHAAFTSFDATAPIDSAGNLAVPCHQGSVFTFDGAEPQDTFGSCATIYCDSRVQTLTFADKCAADSFVMFHGTNQKIIVEGDLAGPLEVIIASTESIAATKVLFTFKKHNTGTLADQEMDVTWADIMGVHGDHNENTGMQLDQSRLFVYSKHGRYDICTDCDGTKVCLSSPAMNVATTDQFGDPVSATLGQQFYFGVSDDTVATGAFGADGDHINTGLGDDTVTGSGDFNIIEDHGGADTVMGYGSSDNILISRSGGEYYMVLPDTTGAEVNEYWVYPTHEHGPHYFGAKNPADTRQCTIIDSMSQFDTIYLRMDDPTQPLHKFSNDDDLCSVAISGWELAFYMEDLAGVVFDSADSTTLQTIHVWFSRDDGKADICLGTPATMSCVENTDDTLCITYWVLCPDKNPWLDEPIHDYEDLLISLDWFGWW